MNYRIRSEKIVSYTEGIPLVEVEIIAASSEALPAYDSLTGKIIAPGSVAFVPSESKLFMLDLTNEWEEWA